MPDYKNKRCPQCGGAIDYFGSCRRCGREWTDKLEEDELAEGLPEGQQHPSEVKSKKPTRVRTKYTKNSTRNEPQQMDKYALWQITDEDNETEIIQKRSLMRLDSRKVYNQMGLSLRAPEAQTASLLWLSRLWELLSDEDQKALTPALEHLKRGYADLKLVAQSKVNEAAKMEIEMDKAHKSARRARLRMMDAEKRKKEAATVQILPGQDTEGYGIPDLVSLSPEDLEKLSHEDLLELAKAKLANLDTEKALRKRSERLADDANRDDTGDE